LAQPKIDPIIINNSNIFKTLFITIISFI